MQPLLTLLQINDSMFPIGGFTHSYGLETYVHRGLVKDVATAESYAATMLRHNVFYNDAAFLHQAYQLCAKRRGWEKFYELDEAITALKAPSEIRTASKKLAIRFLKTTADISPAPRCNKYLQSIKDGHQHGHYPVAFAMYAHAKGISREDALTAFYYNTLNGIVTNCAKMVPISQTAGQQILFRLQPLIRELVAMQETLADELVGLCCIGQEIRCMQHEKQYTRLYIS